MKVRSFFPKETSTWVKKVKDSPMTVHVIVGSIIVLTVVLNVAFFLKEALKEPPEA